MKIKKQSQITGHFHEMEIDVTPEQIKAWQNGALIQDAMPNVSAEEREFMMTGITPEEWDEYISDPYEEEEEAMTRRHSNE